VVTADPARLAERELPERNIDLAICPTLGLASDPAVNMEVLFDDRQFVVAAPQNKWFRRRNLALADLIDDVTNLHHRRPRLARTRSKSEARACPAASGLSGR